MRGRQRRFFAIAAFAAVVVVLGLSLDAGQAAAQPIVVVCPTGNLGTILLDSTFAGPGPLTFAIQGTCTLNLIITRDDVTLTSNGATPFTFAAADPNQAVIQLDGAQRVVINNITVTGGPLVFQQPEAQPACCRTATSPGPPITA
jgi:hypothetical protein